MTTYQEAITASTEAAIRDANLAAAAALGVNVAGWDDVAPQRAIFTLDARALKAHQDIRVALAKAGYLQAAAEVGDDFFDEALTWYDEARIQATRAVWTFRVTCAATAGPYTIGQSSGELVAVANDGTEFANTNDQAITITAGSTVSMQFTASQPGTSGNQAAAAVTKLVVGKPGLSVTNASPATLDAPARDQETTSEAIPRVLGKWSSIGAGWTADSFDYWIPKWSPTVTGWRVRDDNPLGPGSVQVILRSAAGVASGGQIAAVSAGAAASDFKPWGTTALGVASAVAKTVTITGTLYGDGTNGNLLANAKAALDLVQAKFPIGGDADGKIRFDLIRAVLMGGAWPSSAPLEVNGKMIVLPGFTGAKYLDLSSPTGDTSLAYNEFVSFSHAGLVLG